MACNASVPLAHATALALALGCGGKDDGGFGGSYGGFDTTTSASASGGDAGSGADTGAPPPEDEDEGDFRVPRASGRFVYSASEPTDSVAVIDSSNLAIDVVAVGRGPTVVEPLMASLDTGLVVVLDQGSDDIAFVRTTSAFTTEVWVRPITPGANAIAPTADGTFVFVYHDVDGAEPLGAGSDQELTVLDVVEDVGYAMTVGAHPRDIVFASDGSRAHVVTDDGVNLVPLAGLADLGKPDLIPVVSDPGIDPATIEVRVAADQDVALSRVEGETEVVATDLGTGVQFPFDLPAIPTDLDIAQDGTFAILVTPSPGGSAFVELVLPVDGGTQPTVHAVADEYVGLAHLAPAGDTMILYTTVDPFAGMPIEEPPAAATGSSGGSGSAGSSGSDGSSTSGSSSGAAASSFAGSSGDETGAAPPEQDPRRRITIVRRDGAAWVPVTLFVDHPVASVGIAPDGANALLVHQMEGPEQTPWSYTLVDLTKDFPVTKLQTLEAEPRSVLFTPDGDRAVVLIRDDAAGVKRIDLVDLRTFIVDALELGSPPEGAGWVDATEKIFVSQEHPSGRITFIDESGAVETVTGYRLNDAVKD